MLELILAATATMLATGVGAIPVFFLGERARSLRPLLWGLASGVMSVAAVAGLLLPAADEGSPAAVAGGLLAGLGFLLLVRRRLRGADPIGPLARGADARTAMIVFAVLLAHSLPEGLAIGTAYASDTAGLSLFVILAIGIQNVPEGTSVAIPMASAGFSRSRMFWAAVLTSAPQPPGAVAAYLLVEQVNALLPFSFAFAGGAMLALVVIEMLPDALEDRRPALTAAGAALGAVGMLGLALALRV